MLCAALSRPCLCYRLDPEVDPRCLKYSSAMILVFLRCSDKRSNPLVYLALRRIGSRLCNVKTNEMAHNSSLRTVRDMGRDDHKARESKPRRMNSYSSSDWRMHTAPRFFFIVSPSLQSWTTCRVSSVGCDVRLYERKYGPPTVLAKRAVHLSSVGSQCTIIQRKQRY